MERDGRCLRKGGRPGRTRGGKGVGGRGGEGSSVQIPAFAMAVRRCQRRLRSSTAFTMVVGERGVKREVAVEEEVSDILSQIGSTLPTLLCKHMDNDVRRNSTIILSIFIFPIDCVFAPLSRRWPLEGGSLNMSISGFGGELINPRGDSWSIILLRVPTTTRLDIII